MTKKTKMQDHVNVKNRQVPQNYEAEKAVLGCIMLDSNPSLLVINNGLTNSDFASPSYRYIFEAMQTLSLRDQPIDIPTLMQQINVDGTVEQVGGLATVSSLTDLVNSSASFRHYRDIVVKNGTLRRLIEECNSVIEQCYAGDPTDNALQVAETKIYGLTQKQDTSSVVSIDIGIKDAIKQIEERCLDPHKGRGIPTPFKALNYMLGGGLQKSDLILIAARPGQGKTSIGMNMLSHAALANVRKTAAGNKDPFKCIVFSLEMPSVQLSKRMLCSVAGVDMHQANSGNLNQNDWKDLFFAKARLEEANIYVDDSSLITPVEILSKCRRLKRERGLDIVMIDYLQLMSNGKRTESRQQEISDITRTLKIAAKELDVPILLLSQMSRDIEKRTDKTPQMSDLRESGAIEQDADIIMFIHRKHDASDTSVDEITRNKVELHIAKHRNGNTGRVELIWEGKTVSFKDYAGNVYLPQPNKKQYPNTSTSYNNNSPKDVYPAPPPQDMYNQPFDADVVLPQHSIKTKDSKDVKYDNDALEQAMRELDNSGL
jgi:replicative DNA helicase